MLFADKAGCNFSALNNPDLLKNIIMNTNFNIQYNDLQCTETDRTYKHIIIIPVINLENDMLSLNVRHV